MHRIGALRVHAHGPAGPCVIALHGGPAAVGSGAPLARGIADPFHVLEPWQRGSGGESLTVATHIADLHELIETRCADARPALVGESWGAMLALAYAAAHPEAIAALVLVGCGTFDLAARAQLQATLAERKARGENLYDYDPVERQALDDGGEAFDMVAHTQTWDDMVLQQQRGLYPAAFAKIEAPVLMLHGTYDPHPGEMIRDGLAKVLPQLEYRALDRCGHAPWGERHARDVFFAVLKTWLADALA
jgi:pimeloyl-ACP methyl ester carboxylesterase